VVVHGARQQANAARAPLLLLALAARVATHEAIKASFEHDDLFIELLRLHLFLRIPQAGGRFSDGAI
jgi:hypothetical protein